MRYIFFLVVALASYGYAQSIKKPSVEILSFEIEHEEDYDIVSVKSKNKLIAEITEVSIKNPIIYPYTSNDSAIILTDIIGSSNFYRIAQYVKISARNGILKSIYNCRAELSAIIKVDPNINESREYFKYMIWNKKLNRLKVRNEACKVARPIILGGNTF